MFPRTRSNVDAFPFPTLVTAIFSEPTNKGDVLNCCGKMPSLRRAGLPGSFNLPKQLRMSPSPALNMLDSVIGAGINGLSRMLQGDPGRNGPQRDFFPPFVPPGNDRPLPPPDPGAPASRRNPPAAGAAPAPGDRRLQPVPDNPDDKLDQPNGRPGQLTPEQRRMQREERRARRLEKRAERRQRRGLPPE